MKSPTGFLHGQVDGRGGGTTYLVSGAISGVTQRRGTEET